MLAKSVRYAAGQLLTPFRRLGARPVNLPGGYKRIYHAHIRKTGGTSVNQMFLELSGDNPSDVYALIANRSGHTVQRGGRVFVGWDRRQINMGRYFYAFSHLPLHNLKLPPDTFVFSCFRDPAERVISHFNMLRGYLENDVRHPCMRVEGPWAMDGFNRFLERIPQEHLLNQLYTFSKDFDVNEAEDAIRSLDYFFFTEDFSVGTAELGYRLSLPLSPRRIRVTSHSESVSDAQRSLLRERLEQEYLLMDRVKIQ